MLQNMHKEAVLSFSSRDLGKAEEYRRRFNGWKAYGGLHAALEDPEVNAVLFCTPPGSRVEEVECAAKAGKAIYVEKPIARCVEEGKKIVATCREHGVPLMVGENFHYAPPVRLAKDLVESGAVGRVLAIQAKGASHAVWTEWRKDRDAAGGGVLLDEGIHLLHVLRLWGGEPLKFKRVSLQRRESRSVEDVAELEVELERVANVSLSLSRGSEETPVSPWFHVVGNEGSITLDYGSPFLRVEGKNKGRYFIGAASGVFARVLRKDRFGRKAILRDFLRCIRGEDNPEMSGEEGLRDLEFVIGAYEHAGKSDSGFHEVQSAQGQSEHVGS
jgi:predicted dehydrogenase